MTELPKTGTRRDLSFLVGSGDTIAFEGLPPVLSTPALLWRLEQTALLLMLPFLAPGQITVGTQVELEHLAPALMGDEVQCTALVVQGSGSEITFRVEAKSLGKTLCRGLHRRRIVAVEALRKRLSR
jgi:predicted thioesterase